MTELEAALADLQSHERYVLVVLSDVTNGTMKVHTHDDGEGSLMLAEAMKLLNKQTEPC